MTKKKAMLATACFCFALAFALVLGTAEQPLAGDDPCCHISCPPEIGGPGGNIGHWVLGICRNTASACWNNAYYCNPLP